MEVRRSCLCSAMSNADLFSRKCSIVPMQLWRKSSRLPWTPPAFARAAISSQASCCSRPHSVPTPGSMPDGGQRSITGCAAQASSHGRRRESNLLRLRATAASPLPEGLGVRSMEIITFQAIAVTQAASQNCTNRNSKQDVAAKDHQQRRGWWDARATEQCQGGCLCAPTTQGPGASAGPGSPRVPP